MGENNQERDFSKEFSEESFWAKLGKSALKAGKKVVRLALALYFCLHDKDTPAWAKGVIIAALGYFIFPADAIPDVVPVAGYTDDLGGLTLAMTIVGMHVKQDHWEAADEKLKQWFGSGAEDDED